MISNKTILILLIVTLSHSSLFAGSEALETLGERLFNEQRFSQLFAEISKGDVNHKLKIIPESTESMDVLSYADRPSPFFGQATSCATCHMIDQSLANYGMRGYNDFAQRTKIPHRQDKKVSTLRNTPSLIGIGSKYLQNRFSHHDGEFADHSETVLGNFTGRNMGWLKSEKQKALANIVNVMRNDNGEGALAQEFGGSYRKILKGTDIAIEQDFRLDKTERLNIDLASDSEIIQKVVQAVSTYLNGIDFEKDEQGNYIGSSYDQFLLKNDIRTTPAPTQTIAEYNYYLIEKIQGLKAPKWIEVKEFPTHKKSFGFGPKEFRGLKKFLDIKDVNSKSKSMCISCHQAPLFSDQGFYNTGIIQNEYDKFHGRGEFARFNIPSLNDRKEKYFLDQSSPMNQKLADLGLYNFMYRGGKKEITTYMEKKICPSLNCSKDEVLQKSIARIKTPSLRNLGHSAPYLHNGSELELNGVLKRYIVNSMLMKRGELRNGAHHLASMKLTQQDLVEIEFFLHSLNENYE